MDSKLVEEIEQWLKDHEFYDDRKVDQFELEGKALLQRCLESRRWTYSPEEPAESGDYLVETEDRHGDRAFEIMGYKVSKAFGNKWQFLGSGDTLVRWLPIPQ